MIFLLWIVLALLFGVSWIGIGVGCIVIALCIGIVAAMMTKDGWKP